MKSVIISLGYDKSIDFNLQQLNIHVANLPLNPNVMYLDHLIYYVNNYLLTDYSELLSNMYCQNKIIYYKSHPNVICTYNPFNNNNEIHRFNALMKNDKVQKIFMYNLAVCEDNIYNKLKILISSLSKKIFNYKLVVICQNQLHINEYDDVLIKCINESFHDEMLKLLRSYDNILSYGELENIIDEYHIFKKKKLRIAVLVSGQWRVNPTGFSKQLDYLCAIGLKKLCKQLYGIYNRDKDCIVNDVDMFISTDDLHIDFTKLYYENVRSIYLSVYNKIHGDICNVNGILENESNLLENIYNRCRIYKEYNTHERSTPQWYKLLIAYKMMCKYEQENNINYDIIIRTRPDNTYVSLDICNMINNIVGCETKAYLTSDLFMIGSRDIADQYCTLMYDYGKYIFMNKKQEFDFNGIWTKKDYYNISDIKRWTFSPEVQLVEHLLDKFNGQYGIFERTDMVKLSNVRK